MIVGMQFQFFDATSEVYITYRRLPHWEQAGCTYFITWRTTDSIPEHVLRRWKVERAVWLRKRGLDPQDPCWREQLRTLTRADRRSYHEHFTRPWMERLDECRGQCLLRRPEISQIVADSLASGDGASYLLGDFVVMPNHVHVLVQLPGEGQLKPQCKSWKRWTAREINAATGTSGRFWQPESFDTLVRSESHFEHLRAYIAANPAVAELKSGEFHYYRK
jgi:REP element-mobilizing transposase RayT